MSKRVAIAERGLVDDVIDPAETRIASPAAW